MFENISILVPYKSDNGIRDKNWAWIEKRYTSLMPNAEICMGESTTELFSRSDAINNAARKATRDIFIIADSDITFDIEQIQLGLSMLSKYKFVVPFSHIIRLDSSLTNKLISYPSNISLSSIDTNNCKKDTGTPYYLVGGIGIIEKSTFFQCGGFDPRFQGWGGEDDAFSYVIKHLYGEFGRPTDNNMYHLFHPQEPINKYYLRRNIGILNREYIRSKRIPSLINYLKRLNNF